MHDENLLALISDLRSDQSIASFDEAATKQAIVLRVFQVLGWNCFKIEEVRPEYGVGGKRVDYSLRLSGENKVFIEVKRAGEDLEVHQKQLLEYSFQEGVKLAILTNGLTWWFYLPILDTRWEDRRFYSIDLLQQEPDDIITRFVEFLSKGNIASGKALENAERLHKSQQKRKKVEVTLPKAWNKILSDPDERLIELIGDVTEQISGFRPQPEHVEKFVVTHKDHFLMSERVVATPPLKEVPSRLKSAWSGGGESLAHKKIVGFTFRGQYHQVRNWKQLILAISQIIYEKHSSEFNKALSLRGRKRPYFSDSPEGMFKAVRVGQSRFYAETNLSADSIEKICRQLIGLFGYSDKDLKIDHN